MPVVPGKAAFFVHVPRTGGTSVEQALGIREAYLRLIACKSTQMHPAKEKALYGNICVPGHPESVLELDHATADMIRTRVPHLDRMYVFTIVRNPYDRFVSQYCYARKSGPRVHKQHKPMRSFEQYVRVMHANWQATLNHKSHWAVSHLLPQWQFTEGIANVRIYRTETLVRDWQEICFELKHPRGKLPRARESKSKPLMNQELADLIFEMYARDFELFGYERDSWKQTNISNVLLDNQKYNFHYETIESAIDMLPALAWPHRVGTNTKLTLLVHKAAVEDANTQIAIKYLEEKKKLLVVTSTEGHFDLQVFITAYPDTSRLRALEGRADPENQRFIMHKYDGASDTRDPRRFWLCPHVALPGRWYLPLSLPFAPTCPKRRGRVPIIVIQGSLARRDWGQLASILKRAKAWMHIHPFCIRIIGKGKCLPECLKPYRSHIDLRLNLDFIAYHGCFTDAYAIMSCISRKNEPTYYTSRLSSSFSYGIAYKLPIICDDILARLYRLQGAYTGPNRLRDAVRSFYAGGTKARKTMRIGKRRI
jgi:hypothetical protein